MTTCLASLRRLWGKAGQSWAKGRIAPGELLTNQVVPEGALCMRPEAARSGSLPQQSFRRADRQCPHTCKQRQQIQCGMSQPCIYTGEHETSTSICCVLTESPCLSVCRHKRHSLVLAKRLPRSNRRSLFQEIVPKCMSGASSLPRRV